MPTLAKREKPQPPDVATCVVVGRLEIARAVNVTDAVHTPGDVMNQHHAHEPDPDKSLETSYENLNRVQPEYSWKCTQYNWKTNNAEEHNSREQPVEFENDRVLHDVRRPNSGISRTSFEEPQDVGVEKSSHWTVEINIGVRVLVMKLVLRHPLEDWSLHGHKSKKTQPELPAVVHFKRLVREVPVVPNGCSWSNDDVGGDHPNDVP